MDNHNFKIGDRVRLKDPRPFPHLGTRVLTIIEIEDKFINVEDKQVDCGYFPLYPIEIERAIKVGQQLLFDFMTP